MTAEPAVALLTADQFYDLSDPPEGGKMELVCGRVVTYMPVGGEHGTFALNIGAELRAFARTHGLGAVGVEVGFRLFEVPDTVRAPDVHFVRGERLIDGRMPRTYYPGPPDLAVEVVSPDDRDSEVSKKLQEYLDGGTPCVWWCGPNRRPLPFTPRTAWREPFPKAMSYAASMRDSEWKASSWPCRGSSTNRGLPASRGTRNPA